MGKGAQEMRGRDKLSLCPEYINCLAGSFFLGYKMISSNFYLSPKVLERNKQKSVSKLKRWAGDLRQPGNWLLCKGEG